MGRPTLSDVAAQAGVSMKTVSNVVNGTGSVGPATRQKVQTAIGAMGYRPNASARRLATGHTGTIAVAVSSVTVPYFAEICNLLDNAARKSGIRVAIEQTQGDLESELAILEERERGLVDGVIFHPVSLGPDDLAHQAPGFPLVLLGEGPAPASVDHVMIDNIAAAREVTSHLFRSGCRRIAFLGTERDISTYTTTQRLVGYEEALRAHGSAPSAELRIGVDQYSPDEGHRAISEAIADGVEFDGIVARDDTLALGALHALHNAGLSVPRDVAVAGWDDLFIARHLWPPLTTVTPAKPAIAETALRLLIERIRGFECPGRHETLAAEITPRSSTARG